MAIKTFTATRPEELDKQVNEFEQHNNVFATQTHVNTPAFEGEGILFTAVVFFKVK